MKPRTIKTLIYLVLILIGVLLAYFLILPSVTTIRETKTELLKKEKTFQKKKEVFDRFQEVSRKYEKHTSDINKIDQLLLVEPDLPLILIQLEALATNNKVVIEQIVFSSLTQSQQGIGALPVTLKIYTFNYRAIQRFLAAISKNLNMMDVKSISLSASEDPRSEEMRLEVTLIVDVYTQASPRITIAPEPKTEEEVPETED